MSARPPRARQPFRPRRALEVLAKHQVRYVLIGGLAGELLGAPLATNDIDICYERTPENMERLATALAEMNANLRVARVDDSDDLPFILDGRTLAAGDSFTFRTDYGDLDVLATPSGTKGFTDLAPQATLYDFGDGLRVPVVALDDLLRMKHASRRDKDAVHLKILNALKEEASRRRG